MFTNVLQLFSALYSMLPSAKKSLQEGGFSPKAAAWTLIGCFLGGALAIQVVSRILHSHMPSHVVDCEHNHDDDEESAKESTVEGQDPHAEHGHEEHHDEHDHAECGESGVKRDRRPRLFSGWTSKRNKSYASAGQQESFSSDAGPEGDVVPVSSSSQRPSLQTRISQKLSQITSHKESCDCDGPCYGFSEPCGTDCFKNLQTRASMRIPSKSSLKRGASRGVGGLHEASTESTPLLHDIREERAVRHVSETAIDCTKRPEMRGADEDEEDVSNSPTLAENSHGADRQNDDGSDEEAQHYAQHHHHVPTNAFLSIGLQTSIAIALHKLPEGFITYATNHANPQLGFAVFLALFIHNITEGFAMALPLYLAINSRWKAMFWSSLLGGFSQPLGAGVAALWFKMAGNGSMAPGEGVYGAMFAVTAGIMASVALQLFSESLDLTHNRGLCMIFAFIGMGILGVSSALTA